MKYRVKITKCYLVQVVDEDGNEVVCDYDFVNTKKEAEQTGRDLIDALTCKDDEEE